jgi:hypothetical protein
LNKSFAAKTHSFTGFFSVGDKAMTTWVFGRPIDLTANINRRPVNHAEPPATSFLHDDKLNMGPATILVGVLSAGCWAIIFGLGYLIFH